MRHSKTSAPQINTGSMADIAFLLLIFFLVTATIPNDHGFKRELAKECPPGQICTINISKNNLLHIIINADNLLLVNDKPTDISNLKIVTRDFIDNNVSGECSYCNGNSDLNSSDHPEKAVIYLETHPQSHYNTFIQVQDELAAAYLELRLSYAMNELQKTELQLTENDLKLLRKAYPFKVAETEIN